MAPSTTELARPATTQLADRRLQVTFVPSDGVPAAGAFALWGADDLVSAASAFDLPLGELDATRLVIPDEDGTRRVNELPSRLVPVLPMVRVLAAMPSRDAFPAWNRPSDSLASWSLASKLALEVVTAAHIIPTARAGVRAGTAVASWRAAPGADPRIDALAEALPGAAHALARRDGDPWEPRELVMAFLDAVADVCGRGGRRPGTDGRGRTPRRPWIESWTEALSGPDPVVGNLAFRPADLAADIADWASPALDRRTSGRARVVLNLETPETADVTGAGVSDSGAARDWRIGIRLQAIFDDSLSVDAKQVWDEPTGVIELGEETRVEDAHEALAAGLDQAARYYEPMHRGLAEARPDHLTIDVDEAAQLLAVTDELKDAGVIVNLPPELDALGTGALKLRLVVGHERPDWEDTLEGGRVEAAPLGARRLSDFRYEIALGGDAISAQEFAEIVGVKRPIVRWRDQWIRIDAAEVARIEKLAGQVGDLTFADALAAALGGFWDDGDGAIEVVAKGEIEAFVNRLRNAERPTAANIQGIEVPLRDYQERGVAWMQGMSELGLGAVLADQMGLGKAQPLDARILTPSGWTTMGEVEVGDWVVGGDGRPTLVTGVFDQGEREIHRVVFSDGSSTECCDEHLWAVRTAQQRFDGSPGRVLELRQIVEEGLFDANGNRRHFVPMVAPVQHPERDLPVDPYLLGVLLGDGAITERVMFSSADEEIIESVRDLIPAGHSVTYAGQYDYRVSSGQPGRHNALKARLEEIGVFGLGAADKHVPRDYLHASVDQRTALLQGLLDTDGHVRPKDNNVEFTSVSRQLAQDVRELVHSLGGVARLREKPTTHRLAYRMSIRLPAGVEPFRLSRKADVHHAPTKYPPVRAIVEVVAVGAKPARCIRVDAADHLYVTDDHLVTHNTAQGIALITSRTRRKPHLVVCPTSVVGNWEREINRFAPDVPVVRHHGPERVEDPREFLGGQVIVTTYAILRRDIEVLSGVEWDVVIFDEAQQIKNTASKGAKAARELKAGMRLAMTGTPIENRLAELWAILDVVNPGLLGTQRRFTRQFAVPIERWRDEEAAMRLRNLVAPFVLRRRKDDADVALSLPAKTELDVSCSLTREQATLYQAAVDDAFGPGAGSLNGPGELSDGGIGRKGRILRLLTALKQICNHPAHFLGETDPLTNRSGKLNRATEILGEVVASGDRALVFTQFRKMGDLLQAHFKDELGLPEIPFLHGGVPLGARDDMVQRFQEEEDAPPILLVSLRAGGTGLNLTRATEVLHFDRWWNPAVEDQATDRVHRIGQTRAVTVHRLVTSGTIEERIAALLESKRELADAVVGAGEAWLTELGDEELRSLVELNTDEFEDDVA